MTRPLLALCLGLYAGLAVARLVVLHLEPYAAAELEAEALARRCVAAVDGYVGRALQ